MNGLSAETLELHRRYWARMPMNVPLLSFHIGDALVSRQFHAAQPFLQDRLRVTPDMIRVNDFLPDYERMCRESEATGQNGVFTAEPFTGVPWMEAMLGCPVFGSVGALLTEPCVSSLEELENVAVKPDDPWLQKYLEFTRELVILSDGRFPLGQPIMRGPSDVVGALVGQSPMILLIADYPKRMHRVFQKVAAIFRSVIDLQQQLIPPYHDGSSFGFYHLWTPRKCIWFQEDLSALLSPDYYAQLLKEVDASICEGFEYTMVHLHPSSFFILEQLLEIDGLKAIEVNKDVGGPGVEEMLPVMKQIQEEKNLVVWGDLTQSDVDIILDGLPDRRVCLSILSPSIESAAALVEHVRVRTARV